MSWGRFTFSPQRGSTRPWMFPSQKPSPCPVVVIDEDDDGDDASDSEVCIIGGPAAAGSASAAAAPRSQARRGSCSSGDVINIDDDEEDLEDGTRGDKPGPSVSRTSGSPASRTPGRGSPGNRYGFYCASNSSDSDQTEGWDSDTDDGGSSDCEILDDTAGTAREMWETAASRKKPPHGAHEVKDGRATAFTSYSGLGTQPGKDSENLFGAEYHPDESTPASTGHTDHGHGQSSEPNIMKCSNGKGVGPEKDPGDVQPPWPHENSASPADRKDESPPMSVSTPEKIDERVPEDAYSHKDQSPLEAYYNINIYSAQVDGSVKGKTSIQDPEELGQFASVIGEREKHKESVEYKRAAEEEWASRQRQLQIQAEEAKRLRKRKKAEAQRLVDMEKRQKQRLQEVRESQRKNEEAIQLKEQYRGAVRKELEDMERRYWDTTSILRALGISVEGGEVKAFKQALLKFHPDRVSRNDIYQQVKAEETFKFISRLKEKLPRLF